LRTWSASYEKERGRTKRTVDEEDRADLATRRKEKKLRRKMEVAEGLPELWRWSRGSVGRGKRRRR
jgi:hypothetical protein